MAKNYITLANQTRKQFLANYKTVNELEEERKKREEELEKRNAQAQQTATTPAERYAQSKGAVSTPTTTSSQATPKYTKDVASAERYAAERGNRWSSDAYKKKGIMPTTATSKDVGVTSSPSRQRIAKDAEDTEMLDRIIEAKENKDTSVENAYLVDKYKKSKGYTASNPRAKEYEAEYKKNEAEIKRLNSELAKIDNAIPEEQDAKKYEALLEKQRIKDTEFNRLVARNKEIDKELSVDDWGEEQLNKDIEARRKDYNIKKKQEFWEQWGAEYYALSDSDRKDFETIARSEGHSAYDKAKGAITDNGEAEAARNRLNGRFSEEQMSAFNQFAKDVVDSEINEKQTKAYESALNKIDKASEEEKRLLDLAYKADKWNDVNDKLHVVPNIPNGARDKLINDYGYTEDEVTIMSIMNEFEQNKIDREEYEKELAPFLEEHPLLAWAGTTANILGGAFYVAGQVSDAADLSRLKEAGYEGKLQSQGANNPLSYAYNLNTVNQEVNGDRAGGWYNRTNQIASNLLMNATNPVASALMFFSSGYASGVEEATANGADFEHAQLTGAAQGANEMIFEKLSWGSLGVVDRYTGGAIKSAGIGRALMEWLPKVALDMGINGLEEVNTDIANDIADYLINGDFSRYALEARSLLEEGYSQDEVNSIIGKEIAKSYAETFKEGALQGGFMAGGYRAISEYNARRMGKQAQKYGYTNQILQNAEGAGESAKEYKDTVVRQEGGEQNLSPAQIGRVVQETQKTLAESEAARENLKKYQEQYKETRNEALDRALERVKSSGITDEGVRNSFHDSYSGGDMETYARNFANAAQLASTGLSEREYINKLESLEMLDGMGAHAIQAAYASGLNSTVSKSGAHMFATMNAVRSKEKRRAISSMVSLVDEFGKQRGLSFTFVDTINDKNGFYRNKTGSNQIVISLDAEGTEATDIKGIKPERNIPAILRTVAHETFHWLEQYDKDNDATLSSELKDFIVGYYENVKGKEWLNDTLEKNYPSSTYKTEEARISEFVADNLFSAFASDRAVNELVSKNENLAKRVKRHIGEAITFFRNAIKKMEAKGIYQEISEMQKNLEMLDEINNRFFDALNKATGREARSEQKSLDAILDSEKARQAEKLNEALERRKREIEEAERQEAERKAEEERKAREEEKRREAERKAEEERKKKEKKSSFLKWRDEFVDEIDNKLKIEYKGISARVNGEMREEIESLMDYHVEMQFPYRFANAKYNKEMTAEIQKDLKEFVNSFDNLEQLYKYQFIIEQHALWQVGQYYKEGDYELGSEIRGLVGKVSGYFTRRATAIKKQASESGDTVGKDRSIRGVKTTSDIRKMFNELNSDKELSALADKVFGVCEKLGVRFKGDRGYGDGTGGVAAGLRVRYNNKWLSRADVTDQRKAQTLLHEAIHTCTTYYLNGSIREFGGEYTFRTNKTSYQVSPEVAEAVRTLQSLYDQVKKISRSENEFGLAVWNESKKTGDYGTKDISEFVAEMANPTFTGKLKKAGLWEKIKDAIRGIFGIAKNSRDAASKALDTLLDNYDISLAKEYDYSERGQYEGMRGAGSWTFSTQRNRLADNGIEITNDNTARFSSIRAFAKFDENGEFVIDKAKVMECAEDMSTATGIPYKKCLKYLKDNLSLTALVLQDREHLEYEADDFYSAFKSNSEYWWGAIDFNTNCPKRKSFTEIYDRLQQKWNKRSFDQWDLAIIRNVLQDSGIQVACGLCFVEDRRQQLGKIATDYISMVKASQKTGETLTKKNSSGKLTPLHVTEKLAEQWGDILGVKKGDDLVITDDYVPTQYDLGTYEGFRALRENHPQIAMGYIAYNNSRGQQSGRLIEGTAEYKRQILDLTQKQVDTINNNGGLRIFSFSDFEAPHTIDLIQIIEDCSARGIKIQAYTKQPAFARMVKDTNLKLNLSRIPSGIGYREVARGFKNAVEHNGKYYELTFDNVEGINKDVDNYIDTNKNDNIGNVLVGINETQIRLAMKSKMIDFIIPFHTNQRRAVLAVKGVSKKWVNYKNTQNEKVKSTGKNAKTNVNIYTDVIQKHGISNEAARAKGMTAERMFTEAFLQECAEKGLTPRFAEFLDKGDIGGYGYTEGYYKFLVDYKLFNQNGEMLEQKVVVPKFDLGYVREMIEAQRDSSNAFEVEKPKRDAAVNEIDALIRSGAMNEGGALRKQVQEAAKNRKVDEIPSIRDMVSSTKREAEYAPTFYSQMGKVIDGVKQDKLSVNGLINMLKGKGVKDEEIQWSGIEEWLADKGKSVTKKELQEFIQNSMLNIEQVTLDNGPEFHIEDTEDGGFNVVSKTGESIHFFYSEEKDAYISTESDDEFADAQDALETYTDPYIFEDNPNGTRWHDYKTEGGSNYREVLFTLPGSEYRNQAMDVHWGRTGVLAHARIQDMPDTDGNRMLFIDEIQSDWHNAAEKRENGVAVGYRKKGERNRNTIANDLHALFQSFKNEEAIATLMIKIDHAYAGTDYYDGNETITLILDRLMDSDSMDYTVDMLRNKGVYISNSELELIKSYASKRNSLNDEWRRAPIEKSSVPEAPFKSGKYVDYVLKNLLRMAAENGYDKLAWTPAEMQSKRWSDEFAEGYRIEYDQDIPKFLNKFGKKFGAKVGESYIMSEDEPVWSMDITPEMKDSVLYEGQPLYSTKRDQEYFDAIEKYGEDSKEVAKMTERAAFEWGAFSDYKAETPIDFYHGTPNGGFTVFGGAKTRNGADAAGSYWFTENDREHAGVYRSYPGGAKTAENPMTYKVWIKAGNYADIGNGRVMALDYEKDGAGAATKELKAVAKAIAFKTMYNYQVKSGKWLGMDEIEKVERRRANQITKQLTEIARDISADFIWQVTETKEFADLCVSEGLDGVIAWEQDKGFNGTEPRMVKTYGVFNRNDIKSADPVTYDDQGNIIPLSERFNSESEDIRYSSRRDSDGNQLTTEQESFFEKSKIRDENGNLLVVYHGTDEDFTVFDKTKGRSTMDIQGMFFSPWEIDAGGYGQNVGKYYLNITNPAPESVAYKALNMYKGQNNAGVKAREYLEKLGYDGVNNGNEEYIAFNSNQIKRVDNLNPTEDEDVRYSIKRDPASGKDFVSVDVSEIVGYDISPEDNIQKRARKYMRKRFKGVVLDLGKTKRAFVGKTGINEYTNPAKYLEEKDFKAKMLAATELDNLLKTGEYISWRPDNGNHPNVKRWLYYDVTFYANDGTDGQVLTGTIQIKRTERGDEFHDITKIRNITNDNIGQSIKNAAESVNDVSTNNISSPDEIVNPESSSSRRDIGYEAEQTLNNATEEEMKQIVDAVDRELLGDAMGYGRMLGEQKRKTEQKVKEQRRKDVEYYHQRMREIRADRDQKLMALKMLQYQKEVERREFSKRQDYKGRIIRKYEKLQKMLLHPTENQHVPEDLVYSIADFLEYITPNFLQEQYRKDGTTIENREENNNRFMDLVHAYGELKEEYEEIYDEEIYQLLDEASKAFGKKTIEDMDSYELADVNNLLGAIEYTIRRANKVFVENKERDAYALAHTLIDQSKEGKKTKSNYLKQVLWDQLNPYSVFHAMANYENGGWMDMYKILNEGQMKKTQIQVDVVDAFKDLMINKELDKLSDYKNGLVDVGLIGKNNQPVKITRGFMLSLYLHLLSEQNRNHIARGGLTIPNFERYYKGDKEAWGNEIVRTLSINPDLMALHREENRLRELKRASNSEEIKKRYDADIADIQEQMKGLQEDADRFMDDIMVRIESQLTDYERKFIDKAKWFFNDYSKGVLNDATMKMYGFRKASEKNYMPIISDEDFLNAQFESIVRDASLENMGFMKNRVKRASNAIKLFDLTDVINSQLNKVSKFAGLAPAIKEFNNVYNKRFLYNGDDTSVQEAAKQRFGAYGKDYIEYLLADLQGGRKAKGSKKIFSKLRGNSYQAALLLNARVAVAQTASYPTAAAEVGWKPLRKAFLKGGKDGKIISKADRELIDVYTPLLANRFTGGSSTDITNVKNTNLHTLSGINNRILQRTRAVSDWISMMDTMTVGRLWSAAEYYVDEHYNLEKGTEEEIKNGQSKYYKKVAEVFNRIVERTQPSYTTMQRPEMLRNPNEMLRMFTMFMTQRSQNFNLVYDSVGKFLHEAEKKKSGVYDVTEYSEAKSAMGRAVASQAVAGVTLALMKALVDAIQHNFKDFKDDDDDITILSVLERIFKTFLESEVSNMMGGSELFSFIESAVTGSTYYGVTANVVGSIEDMSTAISNLFKSGVNAKTLTRVATTAGMLIGLPASQLKKWIEMFVAWGTDIANGEFDSE